MNSVVELDRKHAYWEKLDSKYRCSFCGNMSITDSMYCSVCGSVMDLDMEIANVNYPPPTRHANVWPLEVGACD